MMIAMTRDVPRTIANGEVTHLERVPLDYERAREEHEQYRALLRELGCEVISLAADDAHPDCVFIEDTAIVLDDVAVITRPGAESRRGEVDVVANELVRFRPLARIEAPATIDGGDVLVLDDRIYVGLSSRTNEAALVQLQRATQREVIGVSMSGALHLKTAITRVSHDAFLVNREWVDVAPFAKWKLIEVDRDEPFGANAVLIGDVVIYPRALTKTRAKLEAHSLDVRTVNAGELAKVEGGVTCCSLLFERTVIKTPLITS
jgi:dimethylargininase